MRLDQHAFAVRRHHLNARRVIVKAEVAAQVDGLHRAVRGVAVVIFNRRRPRQRDQVVRQGQHAAVTITHVIHLLVLRQRHDPRAVDTDLEHVAARRIGQAAVRRTDDLVTHLVQVDRRAMAVDARVAARRHLEVQRIRPGQRVRCRFPVRAVARRRHEDAAEVGRRRGRVGVRPDRVRVLRLDQHAFAVRRHHPHARNIVLDVDPQGGRHRVCRTVGGCNVKDVLGDFDVGTVISRFRSNLVR